MQYSSTEKTFIEAIRNDPEADGPRLIYADWLEEVDEPRADFIRVQCALDRLPIGHPDRPPLEARESELLRGSANQWLYEVRLLDLHEANFERGFLAGIHTNAASFLEHADRLFEAAPLLKRLHLWEILPEHTHDLQHFSPLERIENLKLYTSDRQARATRSWLWKCQKLTSLRSLDLSNHLLQAHEWEQFGKTSWASKLRELIAVNMDLTRTWSSFLKGINASPLQLLDVSANGLRWDQFPFLLDFPHLEKLKVLRLGCNFFGKEENPHDSEFARLLGEGLGHQLEVLDLSQTDLSWYARGILYATRWPHLRKLDLGGVGIGDDGLIDLTQSEDFPVLQTLFLNDNCLTDRSIEYLAKTLRFPHLTRISLRANEISNSPFLKMLKKRCVWGCEVDAHLEQESETQFFDPARNLTPRRWV
ncbi:Hypothetical protein PBC10988_37460 [Planctomycetales bacterium 10988]|nr:Hypothetical protein PBC10988_37460 [Planctomycetales bacterium 10988]